jgi:hypothetical protein
LSEKQQRVLEATNFLQAQAEDEESEFPEVGAIAHHFEPLLQAIAVGVGDAIHRGKIEKVFDDLEVKGWHLKVVVQRIWAEECDVMAVTVGLNGVDKAIVQRVL